MKRLLALLFIIFFGDLVPADDEAIALVKNYNRRDIGDMSYRLATLSLRSGEKTTRRFTVRHFWHRTVTETRSVFFLENPLPLRGTSYLLTEPFDSKKEMRIDLFLPAGNRQVMRVLPSRYNEGLLGSDFVYNDVRLTIPTRELSFELVGIGKMLGLSVMHIKATRCDSTAGAANEVTYYLADNPAILLGVDHTRRDALGNLQIVRELRVLKMSVEEDRAFATEIEVSSGLGKSSLLQLVSHSFDVPAVEASFFEATSLPTLASQINETLRAVQ